MGRARKACSIYLFKVWDGWQKWLIRFCGLSQSDHQRQVVFGILWRPGLIGWCWSDQFTIPISQFVCSDATSQVSCIRAVQAQQKESPKCELSFLYALGHSVPPQFGISPLFSIKLVVILRMLLETILMRRWQLWTQECNIIMLCHFR